MSSTPERQSGTSLEAAGGTAPQDDRAWKIAVAFVALGLVVGILLAVYVLAWDGGAHT
jgi:hypothetical protein